MIGARGQVAMVESCLSDVESWSGWGRFLGVRCEDRSCRCWCGSRRLDGLRDGDGLGGGNADVEVSKPI